MPKPVSRLITTLSSAISRPFPVPSHKHSSTIMAIDDSSADGAALEEVNRTFSSFTDNTLVQSTVIIGAGIIGCSTAYYLSHSGHTKPDNIHLVEASPELFASASGKAAGFLASDCKCILDFRWVPGKLRGLGRVWSFYCWFREVEFPTA